MKKTLQIFITGLGLVCLVVSMPACSPKYRDLVGTIAGPAVAQPGEQLGKNITVKVTNTGSLTADQFAIDLVLSSDQTIPAGPAAPSANFTEDMLLEGGREFISISDPGQTTNVTLNGTNLIPSDTPAGNYYLGLVVDSGQAIDERDEANNIALTPIQICTSAAEVKSISLLEASGGTVGFARMRFGWLYGSGERPQAMTITVFRNENSQWNNIMPSDQPFEITDPANSTQADVTIFQLFSGQYRVVFTAGYSCDRQMEYVYEFTI